MVWTLPAIKDAQLSNIKIFNNGKPINLYYETSLNAFKQSAGVFNATPPRFVSKMADETRGFFKDIFSKNKPKNFWPMLIQNNRLVYLGIMIMFLSVVLSLLYIIVWTPNRNPKDTST